MLPSKLDLPRTSCLSTGNPLLVLPVPSRDDSRTEFARAADWQKRFVKAFGDFYKQWLPIDIEPVDIVERLRIPYIPYWSFEEALPAVEEGTSDPSSIGHAYEVLARLVFFNLSWRDIDKDPEQSVEYLRRASKLDMKRFGPDLADGLLDLGPLLIGKSPSETNLLKQPRQPSRFGRS